MSLENLKKKIESPFFKSPPASPSIKYPTFAYLRLHFQAGDRTWGFSSRGKDCEYFLP